MNKPNIKLKPMDSIPKRHRIKRISEEPIEEWIQKQLQTLSSEKHETEKTLDYDQPPVK